MQVTGIWVGTSRNLGKLYARKLWADFLFPTSSLEWPWGPRLVQNALEDHWEIQGRFRKRVVLANVPSFRFSFRRNHPFGNHPFVNTKKAHWEIKGRFPKGWFWRTYPRSGFRSGGTSAKTTLLETTLLRTPEKKNRAHAQGIVLSKPIAGPLPQNPSDNPSFPERCVAVRPLSRAPIRERKTNKHKQICGIIPRLGGWPKFVYVCVCLLVIPYGEKNTNKIPANFPGPSRETNVCMCVCVCFFVRLFFRSQTPQTLEFMGYMWSREALGVTLQCDSDSMSARIGI